jgi:hypothetical protein
MGLLAAPGVAFGLGQPGLRAARRPEPADGVRTALRRSTADPTDLGGTATALTPPADVIRRVNVKAMVGSINNNSGAQAPVGGSGQQEARDMAGSVVSQRLQERANPGVGPNLPANGPDQDKGAAGEVGGVVSQRRAQKQQQIDRENGGPGALDPQTPKESFLLARLKPEYATEQVDVRPDLQGALAQLAGAIRNNWIALRDLQALAADDAAGLAAIKSRYVGGPFYAEIQTLPLPQVILKVRKRHGDFYEKAKREDAPISKEGVLDPVAAAARRVEYDTLAAAQEQTKVLISGGMLYRNDPAKSLVDTEGGVTHHSGLGVEIFVVSPTGEIHLAPHKIGKYHHSSLLAGGDVSMGGEMKVTKGKIDWMSNKSGHYNPSTEHFLQFLNFLDQDKVPLEFRVMGWGVPDGLTARKFLEGYTDPNNRDVKKSFQFVKTFLVWESFVQEFGLGPVQNAASTEGWSANAQRDGMIDAAGHPVPEPRVRQVLEQKLGKKAKVKVEQVTGQDWMGQAIRTPTWQ